MLKQFDFSVKESESRRSLKELGLQLAALQRQCIEKKIPVLLLIDGWETAGKGDVLNRICYELDPRYYSVAVFPQSQEDAYPYLWRYWKKLPKKGHTAIFNRSFYYQVMNETGVEAVAQELNDIYEFERTLREDGTIIVKLFLHVSKKTHKKRIEEIKKLPVEKQLISFINYRQLDNYDEYMELFSNILERSDYIFSHWHVVGMENKKQGMRDALAVIIEEIENGLRRQEEAEPVLEVPAVNLPPAIPQELYKPYERAAYDVMLPLLQKQAELISELLFLHKIPTVIAFEGTDAAGKGGAIKRLLKYIDPRLYDISTTAAPTAEEKSYHYLRRFMETMPMPGRITVYDRTWYGRVLVERVEGFASPKEWLRAYREIRAMEDSLVHNGVNLFKFFLVIDKDEQARRFKEREETPEKRYKITAEDWRNREKWDEYDAAYRAMLYQTSTMAAPWRIIEGNNKLYARIRVLETFISQSQRMLERRVPERKWNWQQLFEEYK